jgi:hypothetical protein
MLSTGVVIRRYRPENVGRGQRAEAMRVFIVPTLVAVGLALLIWLLAWFFQSQLQISFDVNKTNSRKRGIVCTKIQEIPFVMKKVCIYMCPDGEKTRIDGIDKCLQEIEL